MKLASKLLNLMSEMKIERGGEFTNDDIRIHKYADMLRITETTFAGKRGKTCRQFSLMWQGDRGESHIHLDAFLDQVTDKMKYDDVKKLADAQKDLQVGSEYTLKGVEVIPTNMKPFEFENDKVKISSTPKDFSVRDREDKNNEPTCISFEKTGVRGTKQFYDYLNKNPDIVKGMSFRQVTDLIQKLGIKAHHYCAMD